MSGLLLRVALDGAGVALSPLPVAAAIALLGTRAPLASSFGFVLGWLSHLTVLSTIVLLVLNGPQVGSSKPFDRAVSVILLGLGVLLLALALRSWLKRAAWEDELAPWMQRLARITPRLAFIAGFLGVSLNPKNLALALSGMHSINAAQLGAQESIVALIAFILIGTVSVAAPVAVYVTLPARSEGILEGCQAWLSDHARASVLWVLVAVGTVLTVSAALASRS